MIRREDFVFGHGADLAALVDVRLSVVTVEKVSNKARRRCWIPGTCRGTICIYVKVSKM